ncbi:MAG TPA: hypothetical protein VIW47_12330 [Nitrospiraceae bacterium]
MAITSNICARIKFLRYFLKELVGVQHILDILGLKTLQNEKGKWKIVRGMESSESYPILGVSNLIQSRLCQWYVSSDGFIALSMSFAEPGMKRQTAWPLLSPVQDENSSGGGTP